MTASHGVGTVVTVSDDGESPAPELKPSIALPGDMAGGVWANFAVVSHSAYEFTIDFARLDFARPTSDGTVPGIVVSRVNLSPLMVSQLIDALGDNWQKYVAKAMPKEVNGDTSDD